MSNPPVAVGALLRFALDEIRERIYDAVVAAGFHDVRPSHVTLFRWPGPDGRRPTEVAADTQMSKQRVNDLLRDLERHGYLRLDADPEDDRARLIRLTSRGKRLHQAALRAHEAVEREWASRVGSREFAHFRHALERLVAEPAVVPSLRDSRG